LQRKTRNSVQKSQEHKDQSQASLLYLK